MHPARFFYKVRNLSFEDLKLPQPDLSKLQVSHRYGVLINNEFKGITYYNLQNTYKDLLLDAIILPKSHKKFKVYLMVINVDNAVPHTDDKISAVINYYIEPGNATTYFWERSEKTISHKLACQEKASIYDEKTLTQKASFHASKNDIYVLNVTKIHSVKLPVAVSISATPDNVLPSTTTPSTTTPSTTTPSTTTPSTTTPSTTTPSTMSSIPMRIAFCFQTEEIPYAKVIKSLKI